MVALDQNHRRRFITGQKRIDDTDDLPHDELRLTAILPASRFLVLRTNQREPACWCMWTLSGKYERRVRSHEMCHHELRAWRLVRAEIGEDS